MNKIIEEFEKNVGTKDVLFTCFGIKSSEHFDCTIIAPSWDIGKVIDKSQKDYEKIFENKDASIYIIHINSKKFLYACLKVGAPNMADFCLLCHQLNCENFIMIGSAGSLDKQIDVGEFIVPQTAVSANGATIMLNDKLNGDNYLESVKADEGLTNIIKKSLLRCKLDCKDVKVVSVDSLFAEFSHLEEFKELGAKVVEMEFATFLKTMKLLNKKAAGLLLISDNSANGMHLIGSKEEDVIRYHNSRKNIIKIISNLEIN